MNQCYIKRYKCKITDMWTKQLSFSGPKRSTEFLFEMAAVLYNNQSSKTKYVQTKVQLSIG